MYCITVAIAMDCVLGPPASSRQCQSLSGNTGLEGAPLAEDDRRLDREAWGQI